MSLNVWQKSELREYYAGLGYKPCWSCGRVLAAGEFGKDSNRPGGLRVECRSCKNERQRPKCPHDVLAKRKYDRAWRAENRESARASARRWARVAGTRTASVDCERRAARVALANAVRGGKIDRPDFCSRCGSECRPEGHHPDYKRPLDVEWLCTVCHGRKHQIKDG